MYEDVCIQADHNKIIAVDADNSDVLLNDRGATVEDDWYLSTKVSVIRAPGKNEGWKVENYSE